MTRAGTWLASRLAARTPWTNVYGLARTLLALGTLGTLLFSPADAIFHPVSGGGDAPFCSGLSRLSAYCLVPRAELESARWGSVLGLLLVASGWRPRLTGPLHWWLAFSLQSAGTLIDGGDHVTAVLTFLLLPLTLTDRRRWHWQAAPDAFRPEAALVACSALLVCRVQVALIYFQAAVSKLSVTEWANGTVLYYWFTDPAFGAPAWLMPLLRPVLINGTCVALLTWGVLALETALFMGLVTSRRAWPWLYAGGLALHAGIALIHGLPSFSLAMFGALTLYLRPPEQPFAWPAWAWRATTGGDRPLAETTSPALCVSTAGRGAVAG